MPVPRSLALGLDDGVILRRGGAKLTCATTWIILGAPCGGELIFARDCVGNAAIALGCAGLLHAAKDLIERSVCAVPPAE